MPNIPDVIYKFHQRGGHDVTYVLINSETGATSYYQYMSVDGYWYIVKSVRAGAATVYTFTEPVNTAAATGWTGRANLTYKALNAAFGG